MKNPLILTMLVAVLIACFSCGTQSEKNVNLIENYITAVQSMDLKAMELYLADSYLGLGPSYGDSIGKEQALANWKYNMENLYGKIEYKQSRNVAVKITSGDNEGEWVSSWAELVITYKDGRGPVTIWANTVYLIENGKIVKSYTFYNEADALRQMGYIFIHPENL